MSRLERAVQAALAVVLLVEHGEPFARRVRERLATKAAAKAERDRAYLAREEAEVQRIWHEEIEPDLRGGTLL